MSKITPEKIKELFGKYDKVQEDLVDCGQRLSSYLKELVDTGSLTDNQMGKTVKILAKLDHYLVEVTESRKASHDEPCNERLKQNKNDNETTLTRILFSIRAMLPTLENDQKLAKHSLRYAVIASIVGCVLGMVSGFVFQPLGGWVLGVYTWEISLFVTLILTWKIWKGLHKNSTPTQAVVAILTTPILVIIATTGILLIASFIMGGAYMVQGENGYNSYLENWYFGPNTDPPTIIPLMQSIFSGGIPAAGFALCVAIGIVIVIVAARIEHLVLDARFFKPPKKEETQQFEDDNLS